MKEDLPKWFENRIDRIKVVATYDLIYNASLFVKEGMGIALAFEGIVDISEESDLWFRRLYPQLDTEMYIIWKRHAHLNEASQLLLDELKDKFKKL
jgi:DNA-binding transcriptional LysR family regulator